MRRLLLVLLVCCFLLSGSSSLHSGWKGVESGLEFKRLEDTATSLFRIDPRKFRFDLLLASDYKAPVLTAHSYRERSGAILVINGGFFDETFRSLGLLQRRGQVMNPVRNASWGVFLLGGKDGREPSIVSRSDWRPERTSLAIQAGPRLVVNGRLPSFKESIPARRSAIGITRDGFIEIALSESALTLRDWALLMQKYCVQALNLDGGGSSQISVALPGFSLEVAGLTAVPNAVAVFR